MDNLKHKSLAVLGSTGSIGRSTLELVRSNPKRFNISLLAAGANWKELASQIREFSPSLAVIESEESYRNLCNELGTSTNKFHHTDLYCGERELLQGLESLSRETVVVAGG